MAEKRGECLCGAVKFTAAVEKDEMGVCHCAMCRRWSGGAFMGVSCAAVQVEDETQLGVYQSSDWGERVFCKNCGSTLMWRMRGGGHIAVSAQAFADPGSFVFSSQIFIDEKPANYAFANVTEQLTGAEVIAMFAPPAGDNSS